MPLQVALAGCAHIHVHDAAAVMSARPDVTCCAVWDPSADLAARWAEALQARQVDQAGAIWADPTVDAVVVMSETDLHVELIRDAAPTHKHLYVEKPLGVTAAAAQEAAELLRGRAALFHAGYHLREVPAHLALADLVRRGRIGELVRLRGRFTHGGLPGGIFREHAWMLDPARAGWGALGDLGVHLVDLLSLVADSPVVSVTAHVQPPRHAGRVDPWGEAMLRFDSGVIASVAAGWCEHGGPLVIEAFGSAGAAVAEGGALRVDPPGVLDAPLPDPVEPRAGAALDHFFAAIGGDSAAPLVSPDEAAAHCRILEAIYLAAGSERWVDLEEIKSCPAG